MQVYLCDKGEVSGPFTSAQLHEMQRTKEIGTHMLYWCEGMEDWENFQAKRDLDKISSIKKDAFFPFELSAPPPPPPWRKNNTPLRVGLLLAVAVGFAIFFLAWEKHTAGARMETERSTAALSEGEKYRSAIKAGAAYAHGEWVEAAESAGIRDMETAQAVLGAPNVINEAGFRWIFFDRMIHPVTGMKTDMAIRFDPDKKLQSFSTYP